jgi:hypothetical protein
MRGEAEVQPNGSPKRRRSVRYITGGQVIFHTGSADSCGDLVNLGQYGMLVRTNVYVPVGTKFWIGVSVDGYPTPVQGESKVVGMNSDLLAIKFLGEMAELARLLQWFERENVPWTGLDSPDSGSGARTATPGLGDLASAEGKATDPELDAVLPFLDAMG